MKVKLIALDPVGQNRKVVLHSLPAVLGRCGQAEVTVEDRWVSRQHCQLTEADGLLLVRDLGSRHGTFVNGHRVEEALLLPDDKLTVGMTSYVATYRAPARAIRDERCLSPI
jgi:pSer/pThr/pTyr-binding forkhead associated (FHA) protein